MPSLLVLEGSAVEEKKTKEHNRRAGQKRFFDDGCAEKWRQKTEESGRQRVREKVVRCESRRSPSSTRLNSQLAMKEYYANVL